MLRRVTLHQLRLLAALAPHMNMTAPPRTCI